MPRPAPTTPPMQRPASTLVGPAQAAAAADPRPVIVAMDLRKSFGKVEALQGLSLVVPRGQILVVLGPNGAGKTTFIRILTTLLRPDGGSATVAGLDVVKQGTRLRRIIGLSGQNAAVDENLTGRENLEMVGRFYHLGRAAAKARAEELLRRIDLVEAADRTTKGYSGGMRRRLDLAASLVGDPQIIFLDEPTTGLDPPSRISLWNQIDELRRAGKTILLTTQNLEEAERLATRIAVVDKGRIIAQGTSQQLKAKVGGDVVEVTFRDPAAVPLAVNALASLNPKVEALKGRLTVPASGGATTLTDVVRRLDAARILIADIALRRPTLDDVFLALTGHAAEHEEARK